MDENERRFHLDVEIAREDVVEWLEAVPPDRLAEVVESTLAAGNLALSLLQASTGEEAMARFFRPVVSEMTKLEGKIDSMLTAAEKSQRLGEIGESVVVELLQQAFPGDEFVVTAKEGHVADIRAHFNVGLDEMREGIIEVKLYSNDVPTGQLKKFRRDLKDTGVRYGLMVSLTSRLMGVHGPLMVEQTDDYVAVFVSHAGLGDSTKLLLAATFLKAIAAYEARADAARRIPAGAVEEAWGRLNAEMAELEGIARGVRSFRSSLREAQRKLGETLDGIHEAALSAELRLQHSVQRLTQRVVEELQALPTDSIPQLPEPTPPDEVLAFLGMLRDAGD